MVSKKLNFLTICLFYIAKYITNSELKISTIVHLDNIYIQNLFCDFQKHKMEISNFQNNSLHISRVPKVHTPANHPIKTMHALILRLKKKMVDAPFGTSRASTHPATSDFCQPSQTTSTPHGNGVSTGMTLVICQLHSVQRSDLKIVLKGG